MYKDYHSVCPLVGIGSECAGAPPHTTGGEGVGGTLACGWGVGESQFRRLEKKLSTMPTLCTILYLVKTIFNTGTTLGLVSIWPLLCTGGWAHWRRWDWTSTLRLTMAFPCTLVSFTTGWVKNTNKKKFYRMSWIMVKHLRTIHGTHCFDCVLTFFFPQITVLSNWLYHIHIL